MRVVSFLGVALALFVGVTGFALPQILRHERPAGPQVFRGTTSLVAVPLRGGSPRELLRLRGQWDFPVPTQDGKAVLLERPTASGTSTWRVALDGSARTEVGWKRVFTAPAGWHEPFLPAKVRRILERGRLADVSTARGGRFVYAVRLNDAVSIPK